ncbi:MAG: PHB depolymerase family esterase [Desulfuromonadaceae bacterium]|nr:PHB depolymerase family esterase [Desulfuromonadaceae bacterium]
MTNIMHVRRFFLIPVLQLLTGCLAALPEISEPPAGSYRVPTHITYNLSNRTFLLHVPADYNAKTPLPLVVVLHGAFSTGSQTEKETGFSTLADSERFLVAYPEGIGIFGLLQHWNAGHCCGKAADSQVDDVSYIAEVISTIRRKLAVDPARIYMAGMSNGGMMTYRFATERTSELAAAAVVSAAIGSTTDNGMLPWRLQQPGRALPLIGFHGLADGTIPFNAVPVPHANGKRLFLPVTDAIEFWQNANGCEATPASSIDNNGSVNHLVWKNCQAGSSLEFVLLEDWGHQWPAPFFTDQLATDHPLRGFDATKQMWEFLSRFRRSGPCNASAHLR